MRRADRLFEIVQFLRGARLRTAQDIAEHLEVSVRTIYRDIEALVGRGVPIEGERGVGYILRPTLLLPPLSFSTLELESLALGARFVEAWGDSELAGAAREAMVKIDAVLPDSRRGEVWRDSMQVYSPQLGADIDATLKCVRDAARSRAKLEIVYRSLDEAETTRIVRPLAIEAWGHAWTVITWCELRGDFRTFRLDRIEATRDLGERFKPEKGRTLADFLKRLRDEGRPRTAKSP